ncbi:class I SAM-dependent methyltransferase [Patescibacteria group bacterium]|nr:class I SAM-dependent methyltransferase [Patescibacteria group bacterium]
MNSIQAHFSKTISDYDTIVDNIVFKNDELHKELIKAIPFNENKEISVLDLGCGTGHGMKLLANQFPKAQITGIDFSPIMINKAQKNLSAFSDRIELLEADFNDHKPSKKFDVIISAIAIHNIPHEQKRSLFTKIFNSLNDNGVFVNADFYEHDSQIINQQLKKRYESFLRHNLSGDELKVWLKHAFEEDMPMTLSEQFSILEVAGFQQINLTWIFNNEAIYIAEKQPNSPQ